jgi:predicted RNA binding protein YcfA (HicA-like mRNA interferase family)
MEEWALVGVDRRYLMRYHLRVDKDVLRQIEVLRRRRHNLKPRDVEQVAVRAGWTHDRTVGSHAIYIKEGFWANLSIPQGQIKGNLATKLLNIIEASVLQEREDEDE